MGNKKYNPQGTGLRGDILEMLQPGKGVEAGGESYTTGGRTETLVKAEALRHGPAVRRRHDLNVIE